MTSFYDYVTRQIEIIPSNVYVIILVVFCAGTIMLIGLCGLKKGGRYSLMLLLAEYIFLLLCTTFFFRNVLKICEYHFMPLWSYHSANPNAITILPEHVMNVILFIPVGFVVSVLASKNVLIKSVCAGLLLSCTIEVLQFLFKRGTCEIDDIMNNTLGCFIGACVIYITRKVLTIYKY